MYTYVLLLYHYIQGYICRSLCVCAVGLLISPPQCICICIAFRPYIEEVLIMLLKGMSDDVSSCRDTAFKAPVTASQHLKSI